jgi:hypothetical protein
MVADRPEEFAMWTTALLRNPAFCQELGESGRRTVEKSYDWNVIGSTMVRKYEELAGVHDRE